MPNIKEIIASAKATTKYVVSGALADDLYRNGHTAQIEAEGQSQQEWAAAKEKTAGAINKILGREQTESSPSGQRSR